MRNTIEKALQKQKEKEKESKSKFIEPKAPNEAAPVLRQEPVLTTPSATLSSSLEPFNIDLQRLSENGHIALLGERKQINEESVSYTHLTLPTTPYV